MKSFLAVLLVVTTYGAEIATPQILDPNLEFTLVASDPDIVTPIGAAVDAKGRLFVIESNTHFPPKNYAGPKTDRVKIFEDTDGDGKFDKISIFAEDLRWAMNLRFSPEGKLYLTHRNGVLLLEDTTHEGKCDKRTELVHLDTKGDYPHNGIHGIAFGPGDTLYLGMGENLGAPYKIIGSDGSQYAGNGDGGNAYRCRRDGSKLELFAVGGWNLFALECDAAGTLFAVDNDPDSRPPCRLLHLIEGGDYGFRFRHGRDGLSPFTAWNGELPGTLPFVAGTGEAPSAVMDTRRAKLPASLANALLVTSWGDHDLEIFRPEPKGASFTAKREVIVQGDADFRPVGLAPAPDGSVYVTDWVKQDYNVHGHGRIWKLSAKKGAVLAKNQPPIAARSVRVDSLRAIRPALQSEDPFVRSAAVTAWVKMATAEQLTGEFDSKEAAVRLGALLALHRGKTADFAPLLRRALTDADERVRLAAVQWIGDEKLGAFAEDLPNALIGSVSSRLFAVEGAAVAALSKTAAAPPSDGKIHIFDLNPVEPIALPLNQKSEKTNAPLALQANEKRPTTDAEWRVELDTTKGDAEAGRKVFFRDTTACSKCHSFEGRGGKVGPDLTYIAYNALERDIREKLMQSILHPSRDIAPQFVQHQIETNEGEGFTGRLVSQTSDGSITLYTADGKGVFIPKAQIVSNKQSKISLMPEGLIEGMSVKDFRDLLGFLQVRR